MVIPAIAILSHLKNDGVQALAHPADRTVLFGQILALVKVVGLREDFPHFLETDAPFRACS